MSVEYTISQKECAAMATAVQRARAFLKVKGIQVQMGVDRQVDPLYWFS